MSGKKRVLVVGAGPAGLAAGVRLLEEAGDRLEVHLIHMGHHVGGKAASHREADGRFVEHGWHMLVGFYARMRALMTRAGISPGVLHSLGGVSYPYEPSTGKIHPLEGGRDRLSFAAFFALSYRGFPFADKMNFSRFMAEAFAVAGSGENLERYDDVCFSTWAVERGLRPHLTHYSLFRFFREAYFNFPEEISAYHVLQTLRLMRTRESGQLSVVDGPYSEKIWEPIAAHFARLGGKREPYLMATGWEYDGRRITGVRVARPDSLAHREGFAPWTTPRVPAAAGTEYLVDGFDFVISTVPHAVFVTLNEADTRWWASDYFSRMKHLRSAATVSMTVETERPTMPWRAPVFGFPAPLGIAINMTPYWEEFREKPGSAIAFVGQEGGFEAWSDQEIADFTLDNFARVPGGDVRAAGIKHLELHRNRADFERLLLGEPGVNRFRPGPRTPFRNFFLAGDWVRNEVDVMCMEGAIRSGETAADLVVKEALA